MASELSCISNPFALITKIGKGHSTVWLRTAIREDITPKEAIRWMHNLDGAVVAFRAAGRLDLADTAEELARHFEEMTAVVVV